MGQPRAPECRDLSGHSVDASADCSIAGCPEGARPVAPFDILTHSFVEHNSATLMPSITNLNDSTLDFSDDHHHHHRDWMNPTFNSCLS
jgi:hypothetical protein